MAAISSVTRCSGGGARVIPGQDDGLARSHVPFGYRDELFFLLMVVVVNGELRNARVPRTNEVTSKLVNLFFLILSFKLQFENCVAYQI